MTKQGKLLQIRAHVDCMSRKRLKMLGLLESQLMKPEVVVGSADKTRADLLRVFSGKVMAMEGLKKF